MEQVPMEDRLKAMPRDDETDKKKLSKRSKTNLTGGDSLAVLLEQGLRSGDKHILDQILDKSEDAIVCSTIKQLSIQSLAPLLKELNSRLKNKTDLTACIKWLRYTLVQNTSFLSSNPELVEELCSYYREFESRISLMQSMIKLQGKINFLLDQYDEANNKDHFKVDDQDALAVFEDASSTDTESEAALDKEAESENEEDWNDLDWNENDENKKDDDDTDEELLRLSGSKKGENIDDEDSMSQMSVGADNIEDSAREEEDGGEEDDDESEDMQAG
uniref:Small-subunit processome Utp12 domain-containing protein n=1 Tax=Romanomermis culicivorax TaxID=13658 RepID=A0A915K539_ROMCU